MKIYAPVKDFNGWRNTVRFVNGVGETNDSRLIEWFRSHGYSVEKCDKTIEPSTEKCEFTAETWEVGGGESIEETEPDFNAMTPLELREWMKENGYSGSIKNIRNKEKLLEIIRG